MHLAATPWNTIFAPGPMLAKAYSTLTNLVKLGNWYF
jgi:hypothetical protein